MGAIALIQAPLSSSTLEPKRKPLRESGRADFLRGGTMVIWNAKKCNPLPRRVEKRVARQIVPVARLAGGTDDRQPLAVSGGGHRGSRYRSERHRMSTRTHVVQVWFMDVSTKDEIGIGRLDTFFRLFGTSNVSPISGCHGAGVHEQEIVLPCGKRQTCQKGFLPVAKLRLRPGDRDLRAGIECFNTVADRGRIMIALHYHCAIGRVLFDQFEHRHRVCPVTNKVTKKCEPFGAQRLGVRKAGSNGLQIAMNVGKQSPFLCHQGRIHK